MDKQYSDTTKFLTNQKSSEDFYSHPLFRKKEQAEKLEFNKMPVESEQSTTYEQSNLSAPKSLER